MCRADVSPAATPVLAQVLEDMAHAIADLEGVSRDQIRIGPVDFGPGRAPHGEAPDDRG